MSLKYAPLNRRAGRQEAELSGVELSGVAQSGVERSSVHLSSVVLCGVGPGVGARGPGALSAVAFLRLAVVATDRVLRPLQYH